MIDEAMLFDGAVSTTICKTQERKIEEACAHDRVYALGKSSANLKKNKQKNYNKKTKTNPLGAIPRIVSN